MSGVFSKQLVFGVLIVLILFVLLAWFVDWEQVLVLLRGLNPWHLLLASFFLLLGYLAYAQRWRLLLEKQSGYMATFHAANAGNMVNTLLPLRPGDAARILSLGGVQGLSYAQVTSSIVVERWFEQMMRLAALGGAMLFGMGMAVSVMSVIGAILFITAAYLFMLCMVQRRESVLAVFPRWLAQLPRIKEDVIRQGLGDLIDGLSGLSSARYLLVLIIWSCITWGLFWAFHFSVFVGLGVNTTIETALAISLGALALVPPSATTLPGIFQVSMVVPLALVGYDENLLTSYALVLNTLEMAWILVLGIWGVTKSGYTFRRLIVRRGKVDAGA